MAERNESRPSVAVVGAGVMGTGIAAHFASAGYRTLLCDIVPKDATDTTRSRLSVEAIGKALKSKPSPFFDADAARLIKPGNLEDDIKEIGACELIVEAVTERLDIKQSLFNKLAPALGPHTIVASNTSGLSLSEMSAQMPQEMAARFAVMHFFNPVRYMHLVELVAGPKTSPEVMDKLARISARLGKGVVRAKDTVNFVANRIGVFSMMHAIGTMDSFGLSIEEVDKIAGAPLARPASAAFRTADLVGIDTLAHVAKNCLDNLPQDPYRDAFKLPSWVEAMIGRGQLGQKVGQGFYKKVGKDIQVLEPQSGSYRAQKKVQFDSLGALKGVHEPGAKVRKLIDGSDNAAKFGWGNVSATLIYAAGRLGEIADDIVNIDRGMRWGFNWDLGPFEVWDAIGIADSVARMKREGQKVPAWVDEMVAAGHKSFYDSHEGQARYYDPTHKAMQPIDGGKQSLSFALLHAQPKRELKRNDSASLIDLGDGACAIEVHTRMNVLDLEVMDIIEHAAEQAHAGRIKALVLANDGEHFGAGFNLKLLLEAITQKDYAAIEKIIARFQNCGQALRYAPVPVVAAPFQYTFGGALELALAADACQAHAETYMGLVEAGVGLIPGGGGCLRLLERATHAARMVDADLMPFVGFASLQIATAKVSSGAHDARRMFYLRASDGISLDRDRLLSEARALALGMAHAGYVPPVPPVIKAAGADAMATIGMRVWSMQEGRHISEHDGLVAREVAKIICGGQVSAGTELGEQHILDLERESFLKLCGTEKTKARIESMMLYNTPLRN